MHPGQCMSCDPDHVINNVCTGKRFKITSFKRNLLYNKVGVAIVGVVDNIMIITLVIYQDVLIESLIMLLKVYCQY